MFTYVLLKYKLSFFPQNLLPGEDLGVPGSGVVYHGVGDDLSARRQLVAVLVVGDDLNGRDGGSVWRLSGGCLQVRGQGGETGGLARPHSHGGEAGGGGRAGLLVCDLSETHTARHCEQPHCTECTGPHPRVPRTDRPSQKYKQEKSYRSVRVETFKLSRIISLCKVVYYGGVFYSKFFNMKDVLKWMMQILAVKWNDQNQVSFRSSLLLLVQQL